MNVLITGGTGLIGTKLTKLLKGKGYDVKHLSRSPSPENQIPTFLWKIENGEIDEEAFNGVDAIIHLAGAGIAEKRWTEERKKVIISSRVDSANLLYKAVRKTNTDLKVFLSASGINYYGMTTTDKIFREDDPPSKDFIGKCCVLWEEAADQFSEICRVVKLRTGVVFSKQGGALEKISKPVKFGIGAPLGSGKQWVPYIHIDDLCRMYLKALEDESTEGVYNAVNGDHITNKKLTKETASALDKPLWLPNVPAFVLKAALGEMAGLVLEGSRASADKIQKEGFEFKYKTLESALNDIYGD